MGRAQGHLDLSSCLLDFEATYVALCNFTEATRRCYASDLRHFLAYLSATLGIESANEVQRSHLYHYLADTTEQLKRLRPHAIVMEGRQENLPLREAGRDLAPALFIEVHPQEDLMDVYGSRQVVAASPETLVEAICSASAKATSG